MSDSHFPRPYPDQEQHPCPTRRSGPRRGRIRALLAVFVALPAVLACEDDLFRINWFSNPQEATVYSMAVPELNIPTGFDFINRRSVRIESSQSVGRWDLAVDTQAGELVFLTPDALDVPSRAAILMIPDTAFADVLRAPADTTLYSHVEPVPLALGNVYVIRTRQVPGSFGQSCVYYAKLEPLAIDVDLGRLTFVFDASPVCNDRRLIPPE